MHIALPPPTATAAPPPDSAAGTPPPALYVRSVHPFAALNPATDLTFVAGVEIRILQQHVAEGPDWMRGEYEQAVGMVPVAYVSAVYSK